MVSYVAIPSSCTASPAPTSRSAAGICRARPAGLPSASRAARSPTTGPAAAAGAGGGGPGALTALPAGQRRARRSPGYGDLRGRRPALRGPRCSAQPGGARAARRRARARSPPGRCPASRMQVGLLAGPAVGGLLVARSGRSWPVRGRRRRASPSRPCSTAGSAPTRPPAARRRAWPDRRGPRYAPDRRDLLARTSSTSPPC